MEKLKAVFGVLFFLVVAGGFAYWQGPDLIDDVVHRNAKFEPARDVRIKEARCRSKMFVLTTCDVTATGTAIAGGEKKMSLLFTGPVGDASISLIRAAGTGAPATRHLTTDYAMENITNRLLSLAFWAIMMLVLAFGCLLALTRKAH